MNDAIYLRQGSELVEMTEESYEYERVLQDKLSEYPRLLAGGQMSERGIDRWALIAREKSVPDKRGGGERWSADHLFVDQNAVPTIVEVKRSDNTEIRRKIVGQMLDYVAHASMFWDARTLSDRFAETCDTLGVSPEERLADLVGEEVDTREFWEDVEKNLRSKQIRLLFVADEVPGELKQVVEFLNEAMHDVDVLAIEVVQYVGEDETVFVPRLYGQTEEAKASSSTSSSRRGSEYVESEEELYEDLDERASEGDITEEVRRTFVELYEFSKELGDDIDISGAKSANYKLKVDAHRGSFDGRTSIFTASLNGGLQIWPANRPYTGDEVDAASVAWDESAYEAYSDGFQSLEGVSEGDTDVYFEGLAKGDNLEVFKGLVEEFVDRCRNSSY